MKFRLVALTAAVSAAFLFAGCDSKSKPSAEKAKTSDVTVGDTADYATGLTPLKTEKKAKDMLNKINAKRTEQEKQAIPVSEPEK